MSALVDRARKYLSAIPGAVAGQSGHNQTFVAACALVNGFALNESDALMLLREWNARCQPPWSERELQHKIESAALAAHTKARGYLIGTGGVRPPAREHTPNVTRRPKLEPVEAARAYLKGFACDEAAIAEASPIRLPDGFGNDGVALLNACYRPGERVNFVVEYEQPEPGKCRPSGIGITVERDALISTWTREGVKSSAAGGWLRMNPLDGSGVADSNVTAHRFALLESDKLPTALQLSLFARLPLPIAVILSSGARSLHAWVKVDAPAPDEYRQLVGEMMNLLAPLGLDRKNRNPSRLSRLPGAKREIGAVGDGRQRLVYLNPSPTGERILQ